MSRFLHNTTSLGLATFYALIAVLGHALHDHGSHDHSSHGHGGCNHLHAACDYVADDHVADDHSTCCDHHTVAVADRPTAGCQDACPCQHHQHQKQQHQIPQSEAVVACCSPDGNNPTTGPTTRQAFFAASPHTCLGCQLISQLSVGYYHSGLTQAEQPLSCPIAGDYQQPQIQGFFQVAFARGPPAIS